MKQPLNNIEKKIKIITIGIEEVPEGFCNPMWLKVKPSHIRVSDMFTAGLDITTMEDTNIRMEYPLEYFAVGYDSKPFYIRTKDKEAFLELIKGWLEKTKKETINALCDDLNTLKATKAPTEFGSLNKGQIFNAGQVNILVRVLEELQEIKK